MNSSSKDKLCVSRPTKANTRPNGARRAEAGDGDAPVEAGTDVHRLAPVIDYVVGHPLDPRPKAGSKQVASADSTHGDDSYNDVGVRADEAAKSSIKYCMNCCCHLASPTQLRILSVTRPQAAR